MLVAILQHTAVSVSTLSALEILQTVLIPVGVSTFGVLFGTIDNPVLSILNFLWAGNFFCKQTFFILS